MRQTQVHVQLKGIYYKMISASISAFLYASKSKFAGTKPSSKSSSFLHEDTGFMPRLPCAVVIGAIEGTVAIRSMCM